jgi:Tfp pilus assembly protein PilO
MKNLIAIALILAAIGIVFGYVRPQYNGAIKEKREELKSYEETLTMAKELEAKVSSFKARIGALDKEDMAKLEKMLPDTVSNVNLVIDINTIAANSGLVIRDISLEESKPQEQGKTSAPASNNEPYESIDLSFSVDATYSNFQNFLNSLERSLRLVDVVAVSFTPGETDRYDFKVTVRTYWLK